MTSTRASLVVGVTGHIEQVRSQTIEERGRLRSKLRDEVFLPLLNADEAAVWADGKSRVQPYRVPNTPLLVLSSLAEGADRVVVEAAFEAARLLERDADVALVAILPMPPDEYRKTFDDPDSADFDELIARASRVHVVPENVDTGNWAKGSEEFRHIQYAVAGFAISRWSQVLIAVWDGQEREKRLGGTEHVVDMNLSGVVGDSSLAEALRKLSRDNDEIMGFTSESLDVPSTGPVLVISPNAEGPVEVRLPVGHDSKEFERYFRELLGRLATFNSEVRALDQSDPAIKESRQQLTGSSGMQGLDPVLQTLVDAFAEADILARRYQGKANRAYKAVYGIVLCAALAFAGYAHGFEWGDPVQKEEPGQEWAITIYVLLLAIAGVLHFRSTHRGEESKHWNYRALAEGIRVLFYWRAACISTPVSKHYLHRQRNELDWVRAALGGWSLLALPEACHLPSSASTEGVRMVLRSWLGAQTNYYRKSYSKREHRLESCELLGDGLFLASVAFSAWEALHATSSLARFFVSMALTAAGVVLLTRVARTFRELRSGNPSRLLHGALLFLGGVLAGALIAWATHLMGEFASQGASIWRDDKHAWHVIGMVIPAILAGLLHAYARQRAFADEKERFQRMHAVYVQTALHLHDLAGEKRPAVFPEEESEVLALFTKLAPSLVDQESLQKLLESVGKESLIEHADWVLLHRTRPINLPHVT